MVEDWLLAPGDHGLNPGGGERIFLFHFWVSILLPFTFELIHDYAMWSIHELTEVRLWETETRNDQSRFHYLCPHRWSPKGWTSCSFKMQIWCSGFKVLTSTPYNFTVVVITFLDLFINMFLGKSTTPFINKDDHLVLHFKEFS